MTWVNRQFAFGRVAGWLSRVVWDGSVGCLMGLPLFVLSLTGLSFPGAGGPSLVTVAGAAEESAAEESAADNKEAPVLELAGGQWTLQVPEGWEVGRPRVTMVEHEIKVPRAKGDAADGRLTMMAAGGSVQANIDRWVAQFKNSQGPKVDKIKVGEAEVQVVELSGTFLERAGGPATPPTDRPNYRLLGAIIPLGDNGNYFLKLTGPDQTIADNAAAFGKAVEGLKKGR